MGRLKLLPSTIGVVSTAVATVPPKQADSYYRTPEWARLRKACLDRDGWRCQIAGPGCEGRATIADHVVSRRNGGADDLSNLRAACRTCDNRLKEDHLGRRRGTP